MKGVVLKHSKLGTYILDERGDFQRVSGFSSKPIGSEVTFYPLIKPVMRVAAVAACLLLVITGSLFAQKWDAPAIAVYVDVNPGVRMEVNALGNVISTASTNSDGEKMLDMSKPRGRLDEALAMYFEAVQESGFDISSGGSNKVLLTFVCDDSALTMKINDILKQLLEQFNADIVFATKNDESRAFELGVTPGRLIKAEEFSDKYPDMSVTDIARIDINALTEEPAANENPPDVKQQPAPEDIAPDEGDSDPEIVDNTDDEQKSAEDEVVEEIDLAYLT